MHGRLVVADVQPESPAAKAGVQIGDVVKAVEGQAVGRADILRELLQMRSPGEKVTVAVLRDDRPVELTATLAATSRPLSPPAQRLTLGVALGEAKEGDGVTVESVRPGSPAARAGLKAGDLILKINNTPLTGSASLIDVLAERKPGDQLALLCRREGKEVELKAELTADNGPGRRSFNREAAPLPYWTKEVYRLAVVRVEFADVKHNEKIPNQEWPDLLFSQGTYNRGNNATGQPVHGSLHDYFREQSYGAFRIEGKVCDWVEVGKKRADYSQGSGTSNQSVLLAEAVDKLLARDGKESLRGFDGLFFVYAGDRVPTNRGALYYPHSGQLFHQGKRWPYLLGAEGGKRMTTISDFAREFAFLLGLPDLSARPENPGSEGAGVWCLLSEPLGDGRPQHLSAWAKQKLGWLKPIVLDPTVKQKLVLAPVTDAPNECFQVLIKRDGSEYLLLENRRKKGFDSSLPAEGLLIWRVVHDRPVLEESHGVEGSAGPRVFLDRVPYPSPSNNAFTPYTTPSSRSVRGGGLPVYLTEIRRVPEGRIALHIGYEYQ